MNACPVCGSELRETARFCDSCGAGLEPRAQPPPPNGTPRPLTLPEQTLPNREQVPSPTQVWPTEHGAGASAPEAGALPGWPRTTATPEGVGWRPSSAVVHPESGEPAPDADSAPAADSRGSLRPAGTTIHAPRSAAAKTATALLVLLTIAATALVLRAVQTGLYSSDTPTLVALLVTAIPFLLAAAAVRSWHRGGGTGLAGEVRGLRERQEVGPQKESWTVQSFRLERFDASGNRLSPVPVELRGLRFSGTLTEGDWVEVDPRRSVGDTVRVRHVVDHTTGAVVSGLGPRAGTRIGNTIGWLVVAVILGGILLFVRAVMGR